MTLEEAIIHCKEKACGNTQCALEHRQLAQWLKELKEYKGQKPAEWSEEDEVMLKEIISFFKDVSVKLQHDLNLYACFLEKKLKFIHRQPKQEWNEEEKARIDQIVDVLDWAEDEGRISYSDWIDYVDYVQSLKPQKHFKPSEKQIKALKWVLSNVPYCMHKEEINGLLEQLEQL